MHGQFFREMLKKVDKYKFWQWLLRYGTKIGTEALLCPGQEQAIRTNYVKYHIGRASENPSSTLCGKRVNEYNM